VVILEGGRIVKSYPALIGDPRWPTPEGKFRILDKYTGKASGSVGPRWLTFLEKPEGKYTAAYGFHGGKVGAEAIAAGDPIPYATHGCVQLNNEDVIDFYQSVKTGDPVEIMDAPRFATEVRGGEQVKRLRDQLNSMAQTKRPPVSQ